MLFEELQIAGVFVFPRRAEKDSLTADSTPSLRCIYSLGMYLHEDTMLQKIPKIKADRMVREKLLIYLMQKEPRLDEATLKRVTLKNIEDTIKNSRLVAPSL